MMAVLKVAIPSVVDCYPSSEKPCKDLHRDIWDYSVKTE